MIAFDRVKALADKQKISIVELEEKLGFSRNSLYSWKKNKPSADKLEAVADFFNTTTDYLLGRTDNSSTETSSPNDDNLTQFFKAETKGMSPEEIATLEKEWKDYLKIRKRMMRGE